MKILIFFICLYFVNFSSSQKLLIVEDDQKLSNYVCEVTKGLINEKSESQDVMMWNFNSQLPTSTIDGISKCVADINPVIIPDMSSKPQEKSNKKSGILIILSDELDITKYHQFIDNHFITRFSSHLDKIIIVTSSKEITQRHIALLDAFSALGMLNVALVNENKNIVQTIILKQMGQEIFFMRKKFNTSTIFPDKLMNLHGYTYQVPVNHQFPNVFIQNGSLYAPMGYFMSAVAEKQNAKVRYIPLSKPYDLVDYWMQRTMDLTLNTGISMESSHPKLLTYQQDSQCALIPRPQKKSLFNLIYIMPFDKLTWLFLAITFACCVLIWRFYRNHGAVDSHWTLAFGIYAFFIGQGVVFRRSNRLILVILLQLIVLMIFVLSNGYQGVITSYMIQPTHEHQISYMEELLKADYRFLISEHFNDSISEYKGYEKIYTRTNVSAYGLGLVDYQQLASENIVLISQCSELEYVMNNATEYFYLMPQKLMTYYERLEASFLNPFIERLQLFMDWSFEAGLPQAWELFTQNFKRKFSPENHEVEIIKLKDLKQVFAILFIGYALAILVFLLEIFTHDFVKRFEWKFLRFKRLQRKKIYMKKIFVRPINEE